MGLLRNFEEVLLLFGRGSQYPYSYCKVLWRGEIPRIAGSTTVLLPKAIMDIAELSMLLESMDPREVPEEELMEAAGKVKSMKGLPQEQQLMLYGLFKQYTVGDNTTPKPDEADIVNKYKWCVAMTKLVLFLPYKLTVHRCRDAWNSFQGFPKNNAALAYVYIVTQLLLAADPSSGKSSGSNVDGFGVIVSTLK
jgi:acyl-CoA-binding protein